jgi:hypothetical protein
MNKGGLYDTAARVSYVPEILDEVLQSFLAGNGLKNQTSQMLLNSCFKEKNQGSRLTIESKHFKERMSNFKQH